VSVVKALVCRHGAKSWMSATPPALTREVHRRRRRPICAEKTGTEDGYMKRGLKANYGAACKMAAIYV
jgi:hypothetical protein